MSQLISAARELKGVIRAKPRVMVLFYASWCPFCREFLPHFERAAEDRGPDLVRFLVDDAEEDVGAFRVGVYPTVLFFENGKLARRLDGEAGVGLSEFQLRDFIAECKV